MGNKTVKPEVIKKKDYCLYCNQHGIIMFMSNDILKLLNYPPEVILRKSFGKLTNTF
jgi:hypothetical protein